MDPFKQRNRLAPLVVHCAPAMYLIKVHRKATFYSSLRVWNP